MITHLERELEEVKFKIFEMQDLAIEAILKSVNSLKGSDIKLAEEVIRDDSQLDKLEITIDDDCIRILVTKQPAAIHLRFVLAMLKINTDVERIGDLAVNIAKETIKLNGKPTLKPLIDIPRMANLCIEMIKDSFISISEMDENKAKCIIEKDKDIDALNLQIYRELFSFMAENPRTISEALGLIMAAKALERIGDHATNIAERAIYYIKGVDVRHFEK
ncbi:MAG: phosphate signaling complex protein PhoU [Spirochaetota bacterium]|nr:phosphate signaling complex protein PhoU [Spirochaetota bacterium]